MTGYLGRLVDRAVGLPAAAAQPRLAPVFPLVRAPEPVPRLPDELKLGAAVREAGRPRAPGSPAQPSSAAAQPLPTGTIVPPGEVLVRQTPETPRLEPRPVAPPAVPVARRETSPRRGDVREVEANPAKAALAGERQPQARVVVAAESRPEQPRAFGRQGTRQQQRPPSIEVRIGRVEVRQPRRAEPVDFPAPAARPASAANFGGLAAARRYVDRGWNR